jgi:molecular chaperone HtpG
VSDSEKTSTGTVERHEFGAEVGRLLDLVVHALYSDREIFLRELVANAADATDRRRFAALTDAALSMPESPKVRIVPDKAGRTLTVTDDGLGMGKEELTRDLGTIARSGTRAFSQSLAEASPGERPNLIGQFGVGFYSAFMVADRVEVVSRRAGTDEAWTWASEGQGSFTLTPGSRAEPGTDVVLHLKEDAEEFLEPTRLQHIIRKWADHIALPIVIGGAEEMAGNQGTALWRKPKGEIDEDGYAEFYRHVAHAFDKPWATLHWRAEGATEFTALLFVPGMKPFAAVEGERESRVRLHVRRMFITDEAGLLPNWLRFVAGVVDTDDLPLNVSREMLQATPALSRIRKAVTGRVLSELGSRAKNAEDYVGFWENFGPVVKEGLIEDGARRAEIAPLLRFRSSTAEGWTSLAEYLGRMKDGQDEIFYLIADDPDALARSPQVEGFRARGLEVLLLSDHVDAFWPDHLGEYEGKKLRSITQGAVDLSRFAAEGEAAEAAPELGGLIEALKTALGEDVSDVRPTDRLVESAVVLASAGYGPDLQMQRLLRRAGRGLGALAPVLEVNGRHPLVQTLARRVESGEDVSDAAGTLLDLARIQDGDTPRDPVAFARQIASALAAQDPAPS